MKNKTKFLIIQLIITILLPIIAVPLLPFPAVIAHILLWILLGFHFYLSYARYLPNLNHYALIHDYIRKFLFHFNTILFLLLTIAIGLIYSRYENYQDRSAWTPVAQMQSLSGSLPNKVTTVYKHRYSNDYFKINDVLFNCTTGTIQLCHADFFKYGNQTAEILYTQNIDNEKIIYQISLPQHTLLHHKDTQASVLNQRKNSLKQGITVFFAMFLPYILLLLKAWRIIMIHRAK